MQENADNLEEEVKKIYTPLSVAKEEIWRRWNDKALRKKVEDFLGGDLPEVFKKEPRAVLARHVASPNNEFNRYLDLAKLLELQPVCLEYLEDKFRAENRGKYCLGKFFFYDGIGKKKGEKIKSLKIIDFDNAEGQKINKINTFSKDSLVDFHHKLFCSFFPNNKEDFVDMSEWVKIHGKKSEYFYENFLAMFLCNGVLFENFVSKGNQGESMFTSKVVLPSIHNLIKKFKIKPLIVALDPIDEESGMYSNYYPKEIENLININKKI